MNKAERVYEYMVCQAREHPGQPVALTDVEGELQVSVLNMFVDQDDYYTEPISIQELTLDDRSENAKINSITENVMMAP